MANLSELLLKLNLSDKETAIFLALVKIGKSPVSAISRVSGVTRTHVYDIVEALREKGIVSEVEERGVKTYEATDHTGLMAYVTRQQKELVSIEKKLASVASEFNALQAGVQAKTKVRFFDGVEGVKNIYEEIRKDFEKQKEEFELLTVFSPENLETVMPGFQYFAFPNAKVRDIIVADSMLSQYEKQIKDGGHRVLYKVWSPEAGKFPTDNIAWNNKIAYVDLVGYPSGIIIENESVHRTFVMWFDQLWGSLGDVK